MAGIIRAARTEPLPEELTPMSDRARPDTLLGRLIDAVLDVAGSAFHVVELASGVTPAEVIAKTGAAVTAKKGALAAD